MKRRKSKWIYKFGDKITYKSLDKTEVALLLDEADVNSIQKDIDNNNIEVLKIERPKYEVVEKKELLTEKEREYLKNVINYINEYSGKKISKVIFWKYTNYNEMLFYGHCEHYVVGKIVVKERFDGLKAEKEYTLKELGLEEN